VDREQREQANRALREKLVERLEANRRITLEDLMGRRDEQKPKPQSNEPRSKDES
jgi:hypothetical protein